MMGPSGNKDEYTLSVDAGCLRPARSYETMTPQTEERGHMNENIPGNYADFQSPDYAVSADEEWNMEEHTPGDYSFLR